MLKQIAHYQILDSLGRGGMGTVYRAIDARSGDVVALKCLECPNRIRLNAIRREINILKQLDHPGIISILDDGIHDHFPWYTMKVVDGKPLRSVFPITQSDPENDWWTTAYSEITHSDPSSSKSVTPCLARVSAPRMRQSLDTNFLNSLLSVFLRLCSPLAYLHKKGLVHGDLKPGNILITEGNRPIIMDFGLTSVYRGPHSREATSFQSAGLGTLQYMPPEQFTGKLIDARADLFSLGVMLYELLTGELPFRITHDSSDPLSRFHSQSLQPSALVDGIPAELDDIVMQLLKVDYHQRLGGIDQLEDKLLRLQPNAAPAYQSEIETESKPLLLRSGLYGRADQWRQVDGALTRTLAGRGSAMLVSGVSGSGKTRFIMDIARYAQHQGFEVLIGTNSPVATDPAQPVYKSFQSFANIFQTIADICREAGEEYTRMILGEEGPILGLFSEPLKLLAGDPDSKRLSDPDLKQMHSIIIRALAGVLENLSKRTPFLLILDDLQWADPMTMDALEHLVDSDSFISHPVVLLGAFRSEEMTDRLTRISQKPGIYDLDMGALNHHDIDSMVRDILNTNSLSKEFLHTIRTFSEGNPLFISEFLMVCDRHGFHAVALESMQKMDMPASLKEVLHQRLVILDPDAIVTLRFAAVCGRRFDRRFLELCSNIQPFDIDRALEILVFRRILEESENGSLQFCHDKIREYVYSEIAPEERRHNHELIAENCENASPDWKETNSDWIGFHWEEAGKKDKAAESYKQASRYHLSRFSLESADQLAEKALALAPIQNTTDWLIFRKNWAEDVLRYLGKIQKARDVAKAVWKDAEALNDTRIAVEAIITLVELTELAGDFVEKAALTDLGLSIVEGTDLAYQEGVLKNHKGTLEIQRCNMDSAFHFCESAGQIFLRLGKMDEYYYSRIHYGHALFTSGKRDESGEYLQNLLIDLRKFDNRRIIARCLDFLGTQYTNMGYLDKAEKALLESVQISRSEGNYVNAAITLWKLSGIMIQTGQLDDARELLEEIFPQLEKYEMKQIEARVESNLCRILWLQGSLREAASRLSRLTGKRIDNDSLINIAHTSSWLGQVSFFLGEFETAESALNRALEIHKTFDYKMEYLATRACIARLKHYQGDVETARKLALVVLAEADQITPQTSTGGTRVIAASILRDPGDFETAHRNIEKAIAIHEKRGIYNALGEAANQMAKLYRLCEKSPDDIQAMIDVAEAAFARGNARCYLLPLEVEKGFLALQTGRDATGHLQTARRMAVDMELGECSPFRQMIRELEEAVVKS